MAAQHDAFFCSMLELLPAEMLLRRERTEEEERNFVKFHKHRKGALPAAHKEMNKKAKRAKFDPSNQLSIVEAQAQLRAEDLAAADSGSEESGSEYESGSEAEEEDDIVQALAADEDDEDDDDDDDDVGAGAEGGAEPMEVEGEGGAVAGLRARLQAKIAALRKSRKAGERVSEIKNQQSRAERRKGKKRKTPPSADDQAAAAAQDKANAKAKAALAAAAAEVERQHEAAQLPTTVVSGGNIQFGIERQDRKRRKAPKLQALLAKAEASKARLSELGDSEEAKTLVAKENWKTMTARAHGEKVKDDPKLLRKSLKKKERAKAKSQNQWKARLGTQSKERADKQAKRSDNLKARASKGKRFQRYEGMGATAGGAAQTNRPGFEGKKGGEFLNRKRANSISG